MTGTSVLDATNSIVRSDELSVQYDTIDFVGRPSALGEPWSEKQHATVAFQSPQMDIVTSFLHMETADYGSDQRDMERMGRKVELPRTYGLHSCLGYSIVFSSSWIFALVTGTYNLGNGGLAGSLYMLLFCCFGMMSVMLSVAEISSIIPSSGAQYHWTSEFAPQRCHKFLSFIVGWMTVIGWIAAMILTCFISGQQVQSLIALYHSSYTHEAWHASLLTIAATIVAVGINIFLVRKLAFVEGLVLILYVAGFLFFLVVFWVMGDHGPVKDIFTNFESTQGWSSPLLAGLVNIGSPIITLVGADSACHLSEEIKNASWGVPRAMVMTALLSYTAGLIMQVTVLSNLGQYATVIGARADPYQTYVSVLLYTTNSRPATTFCIMIILFLIVFCAVNQTTTASRQVYAFARDHGMPFSNWLSSVWPGWDYPLNALLATLFCSVTLSLVTMAYKVVHEMLNTLCLSGLLFSYLIFIVVVFWRKLHAPERFLEGKFLLGRRLGLAINFVAMLFLTIAILFVYFPARTHPSTSDSNWSILAWLCLLPILTIYYFAHGRKHYTSPVERTRKHE